MDLAALLFSNVTLWTGLGDLTRMDLLLDLIARGVLDPSPLFTAVRPFAELEEAFHDVELRRPGVIKTLVTVP